MNAISLALGAVTLAAAGMLLVTGERWYSHLSARPDVLTGHPGPGVVVVLQEGDCPDARARTDRFAELAAGEDVPVEAVVIAGAGAGPAELARRRRLHRAVLASGLRSTPALLLTDRTGTVRFARSLAATTTDEELRTLVEAFAAVLGVLEPGPSGPEAAVHPLPPGAE